jgi:hypothetical protein
VRNLISEFFANYYGQEKEGYEEKEGDQEAPISACRAGV